MKNRSVRWAPTRRWRVLSDHPQMVFNYFKQLFAQVTNPPIDPLREEMVMSLISYIGSERNILKETPQNCHTLKLPHAILTNRDLEKLRRVSTGDLLATTLFLHCSALAKVNLACQACSGRTLPPRLAGRQSRIFAIDSFQDRGVDKDYAPIPCLLALAAVHNLLVREETRTQVALITESGEPREVMHFALLSGYGASAINPYLALESVEDLAWHGELGEAITPEQAVQHFLKASQEGPAEDILKDGHLDALRATRGRRSSRRLALIKNS